MFKIVLVVLNKVFTERNKRSDEEFRKRIIERLDQEFRKRFIERFDR